jgi:hypothetical protein
MIENLASRRPRTLRSYGRNTERGFHAAGNVEIAGSAIPMGWKWVGCKTAGIVRLQIDATALQSLRPTPEDRIGSSCSDLLESWHKRVEAVLRG